MTRHAPFEIPDIHLLELPTGAAKAAVNTLGRRIAHGDFPAGQTIPMETELCTMLGVSRTVVREAVKVLSGKGMIRTARRYGTQVMPFESWNLLDPDVISWHDPASPAATRIFSESTEMRYIVEPEAAALAARNATIEQRDLILRAAEHIAPEPYGVDGMIAADYAFHATILQGSGNVMLAQLHGLILAILRFSYSVAADFAPQAEGIRDAHLALARAIAAGQEDASRDLMRDMLGKNQLMASTIGQTEPG